MTKTRYTADVIVLNDAGHVLLIERGWDPYEGAWALPGGHRDEGESSRQAAVRELAEETGLDLEADALRFVGTWDAPGRDPRGPYSTDAYVATVPAGTRPTAGDDARRAAWFRLDELPNRLAFDHAEIIAAAARATA